MDKYKGYVICLVKKVLDYTNEKLAQENANLLETKKHYEEYPGQPIPRQILAAGLKPRIS